MNRKIFESDVNDIFLGSNIQASKTLGFYEHGRAIISSLEVRNAASGQQYIHWQRCMGKKVYASSYGNQNSNVDGMGPAGEEVTAAVDEGVIFVEVAYDYQPLVSERFIGAPTMTAIASYVVRDKRDYTRIHQRKPLQPDAIAECNLYNGYPDETY
jgi:hypothetical protein